MKIPWKPTLFVMANVVFIVLLALVFLMYKSVYTNPGDEMILIFIFPAGLGFLVIGIWLFILSKFFPISLINKLLPFISIPVIVVAAMLTHPRGMLFIGMSLVGALILLAIFSTVTSIRRYRSETLTEVTKKEQKLSSKQSIWAFTGWGALGFGLGSLIGSLSAWLITSFGPVRYTKVEIGKPIGQNLFDPLSANVALFADYAVMGGIAGALIGGMVLKNSKKTWQFALAGVLGFGIGSVAQYIPSIMPMQTGIPYGAVPGAILGVIGGAALGMALKNWRKILLLAITGAAMFALTHEILKSTMFPRGMAYFELESVLVFPIEAVVVGAVMGAVLYYIERKWKTTIPVI